MDRIVKSIEVKNYKAFKEGTLHLDPFSLLIGTNSSGKSSLLKLVLMLAQSNTVTKDNFIIPYGSLIDLGENKNIFFNQDTDKTLTLKFNLNNLDLDSLRIDLRRSVATSYHRLIQNIQRKFFVLEEEDKNSISIREKIKETSYLITSIRHTFDRDKVIDIDFFEFITSEIKKLNRKLRKFSPSQTQPLLEDDKIYYSDIIDERNHTRYNALYNLNQYINNLLNSTRFIVELENVGKINSISYQIKDFKGKLKVVSVSILSSNGKIALTTWNKNTKRSSINIESNLLDTTRLNKDLPKIKKNLTMNGMSILWKGHGYLPTQKIIKHMGEDGPSFIFSSLLQYITSQVRRDFRATDIHHVSPLRFNPERYFLMDRNTINRSSISSSGTKILSILDKEPSIKEEINRWLKKFELEVDTNDITHIIQSIKITNSGLSLDITDVGFGISQILPVILISVLAKPGELTIIEQPEIHIHPKMQSELADFFIEQINKNKYFLIETHSEALLKRLRRRMAEHNSDKNMGIASNRVAIHYVEKRRDKRSGSQINKIKISDSGAFTWPSDFNDNDIEDTIAFMQHQG